MSKHLSKFAILLAASTAATAPAFAQDGNSEDWTGFYVGGGLGYGTVDGNNDETLVFDTDRDGDFGDTIAGTPAGTGNAFGPGFCGGESNVNTPATGCGNDDDGTVWSVHAGYDQQFGNMVVGGVVEGGKADVTDFATGFSGTPRSYTFVREIDWNAAARLRAGLSLGSTLLYGTGGLAYANIDNSFTTTNGFNTFTDVKDADEDAWGYTVGGGVDQKVSDNFSVGLLYKYTNYGESDYTVNAGRNSTPGAADNPFTFPTTTAGSTDIRRTEDFDMHTVQVTTSFRF